MYQLGKHSFETQEEYDKATQEVQTIQSIIKKHNIEDVQIQKRIIDMSADGRLSLVTAPGLEFLNRIKSAYKKNLKDAKISVLPPTDSSDNENALTILGITSVIMLITGLMGGTILFIGWILVALAVLIVSIVNITFIAKKKRVVDDYFLAILTDEELKEYKAKHRSIISKQGFGNILANLIRNSYALILFLLLILMHVAISMLGIYASKNTSFLAFAIILAIGLFVLTNWIINLSINLPIGSSLRIIATSPFLLLTFYLKPSADAILLYSRKHGILSTSDYGIDLSDTNSDPNGQSLMMVYKDIENDRYSIKPMQVVEPSKSLKKFARILLPIVNTIILCVAIFVTILMIRNVDSPKSESTANVNITNVIPIENK